jgi:hypothetical protein
MDKSGKLEGSRGMGFEEHIFLEYDPNYKNSQEVNL